MAWNAYDGRRVSPYIVDETLYVRNECWCSAFLPRGDDRAPYLATSYPRREIRFHDTRVQSDGDMIVTPLCSLLCAADVVQMHPIQTDVGSLLVCLDQKSTLKGVKLDELFSRNVDVISDEEETLRFEFPAQDDRPKPCCFAVDSVHKRFFLGCWDGVWSSYDLESCVGSTLPIANYGYRAHRYGIVDGDYSHGLLASASKDGSVCVWDVRSRSCVAAFDPATGKHLPLNQRQRLEDNGRVGCLCVRFDASGRHVMASSKAHQITVWNVRADAAQCTFQTEGYPWGLETAKDFVFFGDGDNGIKRYSTYDAQMHHFITSTPSIRHITIDNRQEMMMISGGKQTVELLTLDGVSRKSFRTNEQHALDTNTAQTASSPLWFSESGLFMPSPVEPFPTSEPEEMCESGSDVISEEEATYPEYDQSSIYSFLLEQDSGISTDQSDGEIDVESMIPMDSEGENMEIQYDTSDTDVPVHIRMLPLIREINCDSSSSPSEDISEEE